MSDQNENQGQPKRGPETIDSALDREVGQQGGERRREDAQEVKIDSDSSDQAGQAPRAGGYGSPEFAADGDREGTGNRQATSAVVDEQQVGARTVSLDDTQVFSSGAEARRDTAATLTESPQSDGESPAAVGQSPVAQGSQSRPTTPPAHAMQHDTEPPEPVVADNNPDAPSGRFIPVEPAPAHNDGTEAQRPASSEDEDAQEAANEQASNANDEPQAASDVDGAAIAISDGAGAADEISEDANHGDRVGIVATAPSGSDGVVTYSLADDADGRFAIDSATGEVYVAAPELLDFEGIQSHEIVVNATSPNGTVSTQNFVIRVNDHDEFALSPVADGDASGDRVAENARVGDTVGIAASAVDEDGSDNAVQYSLSENPNATFAIDPNSGVVTVADPTGIDFESTRSIQIEVTATSEDGSTSTQRFDISVEDINEYTITPTGDTDSSLNLVSENARIGDLVGVAAAAEDADATDAVTYSLSSNPNGAFAIDSDTGVVSVANPAGIDFESAQSMQIEVTATSSDGSTSTQAFEIAVTDENEFDISVAVDGDGAADTVAEDAAAGDQVGVTAFAGDADGSGSGVEYSLSENPNDAFAIDPVRGVVTVDDPEALDFESSPSMQIEVTAASQDGSTSTQTFDIAVTDADEFDVAPVSDLDNSANAVSENAAIGDTVGVAALAQDADGSSNAVEFTLSENPGDAFAIDPESGIVTVADASALDFESAPLMQIEVTATSQDGSTSTQTFDITITDQNEFDISTVSDLSIGANTVTESAEAGASVGVTAFASDGDGSSNVVEYSLSENPGGAFAIDAHSGEVTVANPEALDFESAESMRIDVTATSQDGSSSTQTFEIAVTDSNEFDVTPVSDTNGDRNSVAENASAGDTVGVTAFANDADGSANGVAYSLSENPHEAFAIDPTTGEVTVANPASLDFESAQSMQIEVTATSQDGSSSTQTFDIAVTDSNEFDVSAASDINGAANSVAENASVGDPVGITAFATDADGSANGVAYSLSENPDGAFAIDPTTGEVTVADPAGLDFESAQSMQIEVTATSQDGSASTQAFDIAVTDSNEFDVSAVGDGDGAANSIAESASIGDSVGVTAFANDADGSANGVAYSLSENPHEAFAIDPTTGEVTVADPAGLDFESAQSMQIEVTATSQDGSSSTQTFDIAVTDSNEFDVSPVSDDDGATNSIAENASVGDSVGITALATDADGSANGVAYSLSENPDGAFAIDPTTGEVTVADPAGLDFESAQSMQIEVTATSQDGSASTQAFDIAVTDSNEFDVSAVGDGDGAANSIAESASIGDSVGVTAFANDADGSANGVAYSLSENPDGAFAIDPTTGEVTVADPAGLDFESAQSMQIEVTATSQDGSASTQAFDIAVTDSNEFDVSAVGDGDGAANSIAESASIGDSVGVTAFANDADGSANGVAYSLSENPHEAFAIDPTTGEVTVANPASLDFESAQSMQIEVTATSQDGSSSAQTFDIAVTDSNEFDVSPVSDHDGAANSIAEDASVGDYVGVTAIADDADGSANGIEYSLSENPSGTFAIDPTTGEVTVADPAGLDFESAQSMQIEVTATSQDGSTSTQRFEIDIANVDEYDTSSVSDTDGAASTLSESAGNGTAVGITAFASDADGVNNEVTYSLSANPNDAFAIDANTGVVTVNDSTALDFESGNTMQIEVTASSADGSSSEQIFDIALTDQNEFHVSAVGDTDEAANFISENASAGDTVGVTAFASDGDSTDSSVSYSLSDDAGGAFAIDASTGEVTVADPSAIDYESNASLQIEVTATSEDGSATKQLFNIEVGNESEGLFTVSAETETFDDGASGWSNDATTGEGDSGFGAFLGRFGSADGAEATTKDFGVADDAEFVTVTFDFYEIDSWDAGYWGPDAGMESFLVDVNGERVLEESFTHESSSRPTDVDRQGGSDGVTYTIDSEESVQMGYSGWADQVHEITITIEAPEEGVMALAFGSTLHQSLRDESYGIDNIRVQSFDSDGNEMLVIEEGAAGGEVVGVLAATDSASGSVSYALADAESPFEIVDGKLQVKDGATVDYEAQSSYDLEIVATDDNGEVEAQTITVHVADRSGADDTADAGAAGAPGGGDPTSSVGAVTDSDGDGNSVSENAGTGVSVGIVARAVDGDIGDAVTYSLSENAGGAFAIDPDSGLVTVADSDAIDFESAQLMRIEVTATSQDGSSSSQTFDIAITDHDEFDLSPVLDSDDARNSIDVTHVASEVPQSVAIGIDVPASVVEGSELHFVVEGVPEGASLSAGHDQGDGTWLVSADEASDLTLTPPADGSGAELTVTPVEVSAGGDNLLINGSFESESVHNWTQVTELDGWETVGRTELWESGFSGTEASDGQVSIELDANRGGAEGIYQNVDVAEGEVHQVSFDLRQRPSTAEDTNTVEVYWNGELVMEVTPDSTQWETVTFEVTGSDGTDQLMFMESSEDSDSYGAHIDNVSLVQLEVEHEHPAQAFVWEEQEGVAAGDSVGITAAASDGDSSDDVTYTLTENPNDAFAIDAQTGEVIVADVDAARELGGSSVELQITATSADGSSSSQAFAVDVTRDSDADETFTGGAGDDTVEGAGGDDLYQFFTMDSGTNSFDGGTGWDAVELEVPAGGDDTPWTIEVGGETLDYDLDAGTINLDGDASGTITYEDGSQLEFERLDNIFW